MIRCVRYMSVLAAALFVVGCGGANEVGPTQATEVSQEEKDAMQREMQRYSQGNFLPKGAKVPENALPE